MPTLLLPPYGRDHQQKVLEQAAPFAVRLGEKLVPEGEEPVDRTAAEHEEFIAAIEGKGEPVVRFKEALGVQRILGGIYASAEAGAEVKV